MLSKKSDLQPYTATTSFEAEIPNEVDYADDVDFIGQNYAHIIVHFTTRGHLFFKTSRFITDVP